MAVTLISNSLELGGKYIKNGTTVETEQKTEL